MLVRRAVAAGGDAGAIPALDALPVGPCLRRLREFPPATGLAFGSYGEASPGVHTLLAVAWRGRSPSASGGRWAPWVHKMQMQI